MEQFKIIGKNKKAVKLAEEFCKKINLEEKVKNVIYEAFALGIPFKETEAYKNFVMKFKLENKVAETPT